jgi:EARLY FLOWERING 3 protein
MRRGGAPGKDGEGEKVMGPLFPRLHVNDTTLKGGGPRAPPRNKMALYEQFSVPSSQRFTPASHRPAASAAAAASDTASYAASAGQVTQLPFHPYYRLVSPLSLAGSIDVWIE